MAGSRLITKYWWKGKQLLVGRMVVHWRAIYEIKTNFIFFNKITIFWPNTNFNINFLFIYFIFFFNEFSFLIIIVSINYYYLRRLNENHAFMKLILIRIVLLLSFCSLISNFHLIILFYYGKIYFLYSIYIYSQFN